MSGRSRSFWKRTTTGNLDYDESPMEYAGDIFPGHLEDGKLRYLQKMYKAIPEEYYTKTKKVPVAPNNARSWAKKNRGKNFQLPTLGMVLRFWTPLSIGSSFRTCRPLPNRLSIWLGSWIARTSTNHP